MEPVYVQGCYEDTSGELAESSNMVRLVRILMYRQCIVICDIGLQTLQLGIFQPGTMLLVNNRLETYGL
jgi:hypothetical protein